MSRAFGFPPLVGPRRQTREETGRSAARGPDARPAARGRRFGGYIVEVDGRLRRTGLAS